MELVSKMKKTFSPRPKREAKEKLNIYTISQLFNQLVNFQQLIKSMYEFIGHGQLIKVDVIMDCIRMVIDQMMQSIMYDRHDFELQLNRIKEELDKLHVRCADIKIKSLYPRLIKMDLVINSPPKELTLLSIQTILESIMNEPLRLIVEKTKGKQTKIKVYSSNLFKIDHAVSYVGKDGNKISGDSYMYENFSNGQTFIAISDGMGNGEAAHKESSEALKILKRPCKVNIYSDSAYVVNAFLQKWIYGWMKKGWKTAGGDPVKNKELWQELYSLTKTHDVTFNKVKGHADNEFNNRCDEMAVAESKKFSRM